MPNMCPFEKKEKEVFFRLPIFFFRNKKNFSKEQLLFSFLCIIMQKKISERSKKIFFENLLNNFRKKKFENFRIAPKFFILGMSKLFQLDQKQLFTTGFHLVQIDWEFRSLGHKLPKLPKLAKSQILFTVKKNPNY